MRYFDHYGTKKNVPVQIIRLINTYNRLYSFVNEYRLDNELIVCLRWMDDEEKKKIVKFVIFGILNQELKNYLILILFPKFFQ